MGKQCFDMKEIKSVAVALRALQLAAHAFHHTVFGPTYLADHEYLGALYKAYEEDFDKFMERFVRVGGVTNVGEINVSAAAIAKDVVENVETWFDTMIELEEELLSGIEECLAACDSEESTIGSGSINLLQTLADNSEGRLDKLIPRSQ